MTTKMRKHAIDLRNEAEEVMELESLTLESIESHKFEGMSSVTQNCIAIDCEGDRVPMMLHTVTTRHYTVTTVYMRGGIVRAHGGGAVLFDSQV